MKVSVIDFTLFSISFFQTPVLLDFDMNFLNQAIKDSAIF